MHRRVLAVAVAALSLSACGGLLDADAGKRGSVQFNYRGVTAGRFDARGAIQGGRVASEFGAAAHNSDGTITVAAIDDVGGPRGSRVSLNAPAKVGAYTCTPEMEFFECETSMGVALGSATDPTGYSHSFGGRVGTIRITELTAKRVRGTFAFVLPFDAAKTELVVTDGEFDVPIVSRGALAATSDANFPE